MAVILDKGAIMHWITATETFIPSEHARSELGVDVESIGSSIRMANGRNRKQHVTDKRTWSCSWSSAAGWRTRVW